jgi:hypothetical protein
MIDDLDVLILSLATDQWQKVAMMMGRVLQTHTESNMSADAIAARIEALVQAGRLQGQGDLSSWRHSEVRAVGK